MNSKSIVICKSSDIDNAFITIDRMATDAINDGKYCYIEVFDEKPEKKQTGKQRNALHVWCKLMAEALNDAGMLRPKVMVSTGEIIYVPWSKESFKEDVYKFMLDAIASKESTEDQKTTDHEIVFRTIVAYYGEKGLQCPPWPSRFN